MIEAKIIAHSKSSVTGKEIVTWELTYPRFIHSEFMTHRLFSRNAASSRAIPVAKMLEMVQTSPAMPVRFGANQAGMQDKGTAHTELLGGQYTAQQFWKLAAESASVFAAAFAEAGYHKQIANRVIEPYQNIKTVMTATELDNWFWLRDHEDADPTIHALASAMWKALQESQPVTLRPGQWHVPYYRVGYWCESFTDTLEDALAISSSCCAQVSYRKLDDSLEKAQDIFKRLIESKPCHASPTEHQATPMSYPKFKQPLGIVDWDKGTTHMDKGGNFWSGNFKQWIQHRQLIPENVCNNYVPEGNKE